MKCDVYKKGSFHNMGSQPNVGGLKFRILMTRRQKKDNCGCRLWLCVPT